MDPEPALALWGVTGVPVPLAGGARNRVLRLGGLVFKTTRREEAALRWLGPVQDAAEAAGFAVPRLIPSQRGRLSEGGWTAEPFQEGAPFAAADMAGLAAPLALFHRLGRGLPQRPGFRAARDFGGAEVGGDVDLRAMPGPLVAACRRAWADLPEGGAQAVHGDINPGNVILRPDGRPALLDWDESRCDAALFDLGGGGPRASRAREAWEIAVCWQAEPERARQLARRFLAAQS